MSYLNDVESELQNMLGSCADDGFDEWSDSVVKFVRGKLLESFKNGASTERKRNGKPAPTKPGVRTTPRR